MQDKFIKAESEKHIKIKEKKLDNNNTDNNDIELLAHIVDLTPKYFDLTYNEKKERFIVLFQKIQFQFLTLIYLFLQVLLLNYIILILN